MLPPLHPLLKTENSNFIFPDVVFSVTTIQFIYWSGKWYDTIMRLQQIVFHK